MVLGGGKQKCRALAGVWSHRRRQRRSRRRTGSRGHAVGTEAKRKRGFTYRREIILCGVKQFGNILAVVNDKAVSA